MSIDISTSTVLVVMSSVADVVSCSSQCFFDLSLSDCVCGWSKTKFIGSRTFVSAEDANAMVETNGTRLSRGATFMVFLSTSLRG